MIKIINDDMLPLYDRYFKELYPKLPIDSKVVMDIIQSQKNYIAFGVYRDDSLLGFVDGYELNSDIFHLGVVYKGDATAREILKTQKELEKYIISKGYKGWYSLSTKDTQSIVKKLGAKELIWE